MYRNAGVCECKHREAMAAFLFLCPYTGYRVQGWSRVLLDPGETRQVTLTRLGKNS